MSEGAKFKREKRYVVLKLSDIQYALSEAEQQKLNRLCVEVADTRASMGKPPLDAFVIEGDWPEFPVVLDMVQRRMEGRPTREEEFADYRKKADEVIRDLKEKVAREAEEGARLCLQIDNLAMLVKLLCRENPESGRATRAMDYLRRKGLLGSPLRETRPGQCDDAEWQRRCEEFDANLTREDGVPCDHPGCASHVMHPCEGCGRIGARTPEPPKLLEEIESLRQGFRGVLDFLSLNRAQRVSFEAYHRAANRLAVALGGEDVPTPEVVVDASFAPTQEWRKDPPDEPGLWWWWNGEQALVVDIDDYGDGLYAEPGQHGWNRYQRVEDMHGLWLRCEEPEPPAPETQG